MTLHLGRRLRTVKRTRTGAAVAATLAIITYACISGAAPAVDFRGSEAGDPIGDPVMLGEVMPRARPALYRSMARPEVVPIAAASPLHARPAVSGEATYYADKFEGRRTASGIRFHQDEMYAAHRTYPFGTVLRVTNERNGRSVVVRVVDRGPWGAIAKRRNTIIDVSRSAAEQLGFIRAGRTPVRIEVLLPGA